MNHVKKIIIGVFGGVGLIFSILGLVFLLSPPEGVPQSARINNRPVTTIEEARQLYRILGMIFTLIGVPFLGVGAGLFMRTVKKANRRRALIAAGDSVTAKIIGAGPGLVTINSMPTYVMKCAYEQDGQTYIFASDAITFYPEEFMGKEVRVWVNRNNPKNYYVDTDSLFVML
ncbi:MAG: DUF3592 domain-containing protein [Oscillospiraceae bacterium]|nr:DUF3592 domain-containing protein [Oscillospiraceae bacterium]